MTKHIKYKWRIYADNNVSREIIDHLRQSDMDVLWIAEVSELHRQQDDSFHYHEATKLKRYLLTNDMDFWADRQFPLKDSPGAIILATDDTSVAKYLPVLLRKLVRDYNPLSEPLYLDGTKVKMSSDGVVIKMVDRDTQKVSVQSWTWNELF